MDYVAFVRRASVPVVRRYLEAIGVLLPGIDDAADPVKVVSALEQGAEGDQRVWRVFQDADYFAPRQARAILRSVLVEERGLLATFDAMTESNRECALWLAARSASLFQHAVSALNTSTLIGGRSWDGFRVVSTSDHPVTPKVMPAAIAEFEKLARLALNTYKSAIPKGRIKAVPFERLVLSEGSHSLRTVTQVTIYSEGPQESREKISESNELHTQVERSLDEGAVLYDPKLRTIEVVVLGGARVRLAIANAFCQAFFPEDVELFKLVNRAIDFAKFRCKPILPLPADGPVEDVAVDEIRFSLPDANGALITLEKPYSASDPLDIYGAAGQWPQIQQPEAMSSWEVVAVRLRFLFKGDGYLRRVRTVELKKPNRTNLREKSDADHAVMHGLLQSWDVFKDDPDAGASHD